MKSIAITVTAVLASAFSAQAVGKVMIAGWDFAQYAGVNFNVISNSGEFINILPATYSEFDPTFGAGAEAGAFGTMYWDGSFGSTNGKATNPADAIPFSLSLTNNLSPSANIVSFDAHSVIDAEGFDFSNFLSFTVKDSFGGGEGDLVFSATPNDGDYSDWEIRFAGTTNGGGDASVGVLFSTNGVDYTSAGTALLNSVDTLFVFTAPGNAAPAGYFMLDFTNLGGTDDPVIDNVSIHATAGAVMEGSYWSESPATPGGWRYSGEAYLDEAGIGWINDASWPYVFVLGFPSSGGDWIHIAEGGSGSAFYAYNYTGGYWILGRGDLGWYYSYEAGNEGWMSFSL